MNDKQPLTPCQQSQNQLQQSVILHFKELRKQIQDRKLYVMFEPVLNCDPRTDHEVPKDVLPLYSQFLEQHELLLLDFVERQQQELFEKVIGKQADELAERVREIEVINSQLFSQVVRMAESDAKFSQMVVEIGKSASSEKYQLLAQIQTLSEQLHGRKAIGGKFQPDFSAQVDPNLVASIAKNVQNPAQKSEKSQELESQSKIRELQHSLLTMSTELREARARLATQSINNQSENSLNSEQIEELERLRQANYAKNTKITQLESQIFDLMEGKGGSKGGNRESKLEQEFTLRRELADLREMNEKLSKSKIQAEGNCRELERSLKVLNSEVEMLRSQVKLLGQNGNNGSQNDQMKPLLGKIVSVEAQMELLQREKTQNEQQLQEQLAERSQKLAEFEALAEKLQKEVKILQLNSSQGQRRSVPSNQEESVSGFGGAAQFVGERFGVQVSNQDSNVEIARKVAEKRREKDVQTAVSTVEFAPSSEIQYNQSNRGAESAQDHCKAGDQQKPQLQQVRMECEGTDGTEMGKDQKISQKDQNNESNGKSSALGTNSLKKNNQQDRNSDSKQEKLFQDSVKDQQIAKSGQVMKAEKNDEQGNQLPLISISNQRSRLEANSELLKQKQLQFEQLLLTSVRDDPATQTRQVDEVLLQNLLEQQQIAMDMQKDIEAGEQFATALDQIIVNIQQLVQKAAIGVQTDISSGGVGLSLDQIKLIREEIQVHKDQERSQLNIIVQFDTNKSMDANVKQGEHLQNNQRPDGQNRYDDIYKGKAEETDKKRKATVTPTRQSAADFENVKDYSANNEGFLQLDQKMRKVTKKAEISAEEVLENASQVPIHYIDLRQVNLENADIQKDINGIITKVTLKDGRVLIAIGKDEFGNPTFCTQDQAEAAKQEVVTRIQRQQNGMVPIPEFVSGDQTEAIVQPQYTKSDSQTGQGQKQTQPQQSLGSSQHVVTSSLAGKASPNLVSQTAKAERSAINNQFGLLTPKLLTEEMNKSKLLLTTRQDENGKNEGVAQQKEGRKEGFDSVQIVQVKDSDTSPPANQHIAFQPTFLSPDVFDQKKTNQMYAKPSPCTDRGSDPREQRKQMFESRSYRIQQNKQQLENVQDELRELNLQSSIRSINQQLPQEFRIQNAENAVQELGQKADQFRNFLQNKKRQISSFRNQNQLERLRSETSKLSDFPSMVIVSNSQKFGYTLSNEGQQLMRTTNSQLSHPTQKQYNIPKAPGRSSLSSKTSEVINVQTPKFHIIGSTAESLSVEGEKVDLPYLNNSQRTSQSTNNNPKLYYSSLSQPRVNEGHVKDKQITITSLIKEVNKK